MTATIEAVRPGSSRPARDRERHAALLKIARKYAADPSWGTVALAAVGISGFAVSTWAALAGLWPYWAAFLVNVYLFFLLFTVVHDAVHRAICGEDRRLIWLNDTVGWIAGMVSLVPFRGFDSMHRIHHRYTNDPERDPDFWTSGKFPWLIFKLFTLSPYYVVLMLKLGIWNSPEHKWSFRIALAHHTIAWGSVIAGLWGGWALEVFVLWVAPTQTNIALVALVFNYLPHRPHTERERYKDSYIVLLPPPLQGLLTTIYLSQNYHLVHHLFPRIPFQRYGRAFWEMRPMLEAENPPIHDYSKGWGTGAVPDIGRPAGPARAVGSRGITRPGPAHAVGDTRKRSEETARQG